jgi:hypothetical protein
VPKIEETLSDRSGIGELISTWGRYELPLQSLRASWSPALEQKVHEMTLRLIEGKAIVQAHQLLSLHF